MIQAAAISVQNPADPSVSPIGLTSAEASRRLGEIGPNAVSEETPPRWRRFLAKFSAPIPWMLEAAILLQIGLGAYVEAAVIGGLLLFNATLGFIQEGRAGAALATLKMRLAPTALVRRDGEWVRLPASDLVPDDVIRLALGALVPADARIVSGSVMVDQSTLTGESVAVDASSDDAVYAGALVRRGQAIAKVTATGSRTYFGRTVELVRTAHSASTEQAAIFAATRNLVFVNATIAIGIIVYAYATALPCPARSWWINPCSPGNPFRSMQIPVMQFIQAPWCAAARQLPKLRQQDPEPISGAPPSSCARPVPPAPSRPPSSRRRAISSS